MIMKTFLILVALTRRHIDKWENKAQVQDWAGKGRNAIVFTVYFSFTALYVTWFVRFFQVLAWFGNLVDAKSWAFGQIVAITVWAGPLCEYFHLEMRESPSLLCLSTFVSPG